MYPEYPAETGTGVPAVARRTGRVASAAFGRHNPGFDLTKSSVYQHLPCRGRADAQCERERAVRHHEGSPFGAGGVETFSCRKTADAPWAANRRQARGSRDVISRGRPLFARRGLVPAPASILTRPSRGSPWAQPRGAPLARRGGRSPNNPVNPMSQACRVRPLITQSPISHSPSLQTASGGEIAHAMRSAGLRFARPRNRPGMVESTVRSRAMLFLAPAVGFD
jgi:hypothetical protein